MFYDPGTEAKRALPDNDYTVQALLDFFKQPSSIRKRNGFQARQAAIKHYDWDKTAKSWERYFDNIQLKDLQGKWDAPPKIHEPPLKMLDTESPYVFFEWLCEKVMNQPEIQDSYWGQGVLRGLINGVHVIDDKISPITSESIYESFLNKNNDITECEKARCGLVTLLDDDYITYANGGK